MSSWRQEREALKVSRDATQVALGHGRALKSELQTCQTLLETMRARRVQVLDYQERLESRCSGLEDILAHQVESRAQLAQVRQVLIARLGVTRALVRRVETTWALTRGDLRTVKQARAGVSLDQLRFAVIRCRLKRGIYI